MQPPFEHRPVLADEVARLFAEVPSGLVVDATLGGAGHARRILDANPEIVLLGLDHDDDAIAAASGALDPYGERAAVHHIRFDHLAEAVDDFWRDRPLSSRPDHTEGVTGVLFDLGVSSPQLDRPTRGFSFRRSGPLDMRMDRRRRRSAADVVNDYPVDELAGVLRQYGDERYSKRIAAAIVDARPIETTDELAETVADAIPAPARRAAKGHPARRTFQAIRIEVNEELSALSEALDQAIDLLLPGGRIVALSYHSGEDRLVKERFRRAVTGGCECPPGLPCGCGAIPQAEFVVRGAVKASDAEVADNPRAEAVRLRAIEGVTFLPADAPHEQAS